LRWLRVPLRLLLADRRERADELRRRFEELDRLRLELVLRRRVVRALPRLRADEDRRERERVEVDRLRGERRELDRLLDDVRLRLCVDEVLLAIPSHSP
jgi:hypothetical protein